MYKYHCLNPIAQVGLDGFDNRYIKTDNYDEAEGVLVRSAAMHDLEIPEKLLCVARAGAGVNNIPLDKMAEKGVVVFNTPGANANGVKELVFAGMLLACRDITGGIDWVKANKDDENIAKTAEKEKKNFAGTEIMGKKLGIIGLGAIGIRVANAAKHMGMEVYGYDPYISVDAAWSLSRDIKHVTNLDDIFTNCDFITIHVPLMDSTKNTINAEAIDKMKQGVVILNFARDVLCDEKAILEGIKAGKIRKYVSDFPNPTTAGKEGCIVIPHLGASTEESEDNCAIMAVKEMRDYLENGNIRNSVNFPAIDMGVCEKVGRVAVFHKNEPNMIASFTRVFGDNGINISDMSNKSRKDVAVSMFDVETKITDEIKEQLAAVDGVFRVRVVK
ncbi:phosphoglycerate dehydrogenase [Lacrimispora saccharolytica]|uniref:phosphoglycerate dehydrogenase n=1 Tax=Lacrimispora saccharolytica TaxID=84030 RepID=UPI00265D5259|nr:phosphoglycerate dehydrogenase [Lacrimispora saccharolytica]MCF2656143.1 phosphoglycerate dehydrogenase [Lacrimispora saccharolytica]MDD6011062.1 phosphoglycerate dehydrogenase [Lachnospiraceae bacterium]MDD7547720.1 phosphoglycerate dehydrogenase [Lachnospiraceae bacterium]MDY5000696.1 phosphoglycerate dehydrogenase [Lachnospiraceae bacterium]